MSMRFGQQNPAEAVVPPPTPPTQEQSQRMAVMEKARDGLHRAVNGYRALLGETRLAAARTQKERDLQMEVFGNLNTFAGELNIRSAEEGTMALAITALNSVLVNKDELNDLKFQNYQLHKRIAKLESESKEVVAKTAPEV